jgi:hypothetical protein
MIYLIVGVIALVFGLIIAAEIQLIRKKIDPSTKTSKIALLSLLIGVTCSLSIAMSSYVVSLSVVPTSSSVWDFGAAFEILMFGYIGPIFSLLFLTPIVWVVTMICLLRLRSNRRRTKI